MNVDFYRQFGLLDRLVHQHPDDGDSISQREGIQRQLDVLAKSARRLADDLRAHPPAAPGILYDGYEGEWEEWAYVPVAIAATAREARKAIPAEAVKWAVDEMEMTLACEIRVYLAPTDYHPGDDDWRWTPCSPEAEGAVEFWRVEITERRFSLSRRVRRWKLRWLLRRRREAKK